MKENACSIYKDITKVREVALNLSLIYFIG